MQKVAAKADGRHASSMQAGLGIFECIGMATKKEQEFSGDPDNLRDLTETVEACPKPNLK